MGERDKITPKDGYKDRDKFIIVIGKDSNNNFLGVVVINSKINLLWDDYNFQHGL